MKQTMGQAGGRQACHSPRALSIDGAHNGACSVIALKGAMIQLQNLDTLSLFFLFCIHHFLLVFLCYVILGRFRFPTIHMISTERITHTSIRCLLCWLPATLLEEDMN